MRKVDWGPLIADIDLVIGGFSIGILTCLLMVQVVVGRL